MKNILVIVLISLFQAIAFAGDGMWPSPFQLGKTTDVKMSSLTPLVQKNLSTSIEKLTSNVIPSLPYDIQDKIKDILFTVTIRKDIPTAGLFVDKANVKKFGLSNYDDNELQIIIKQSTLVSSDLYRLLVHELFHAIHYTIHKGEETWLREGLAQYFEWMIIGRPNAENFKAGFTDGTTSLIGSYDIGSPNPAQYGHDLLYIYYLTRECGGNDLFWSITNPKSNVHGKDNIRQQLVKIMYPSNPQCKSFTESVNSFEIARAHNKTDYSSTENRQRYFLYSTYQKMNILNLSNQKELLKISAGTPFSFEKNFNLYIDIEKKKDITIYYLEQSFPYTVTHIKPLDFNSKRWKQIMLKII